MPTYEIQAPNGRKYRIQGPAGANDEQVRAEVLRQFPEAGQATQAQEPERQITSTSRLGGLVSGALKPLDNLSEAASNIPVLGPAVDRVGQAFGMPTASEAAAGNQAYRQGNSRTGYQTVGNIAGTLPTAAIPGGALVQGGAAGALLSDERNASGVVNDAALGGVFGKAGQSVASGLGALASPVVSKASQMLADSGVPQTIGQIASGGRGLGAKIISKGEEALTSVPFLGDAINAARGRGVSGFNLALGNRALANVGEKLPKGMQPGKDMVDYVNDKLSEKYQSLVPNLTAAFDKQFVADLMKAKGMTNTLPKSRQRQFEAIVRDVLGNRASGSRINGEMLKEAESRFTEEVKRYAKSADGDQHRLADAIDAVRAGLRGAVARGNPGHARELQSLNRGWAQAAVMRKAANAPGNATGEFTPAQALSASRGYDDQFIKAAKAVLPNTTPDSGTARRGATTLGALMAGGGAGAATLSPWLAVPGVGSLLYTKAGQDAINKLVFAPRGPALKKAGTALRGAGRVAPAMIPALLKDHR